MEGDHVIAAKSAVNEWTCSVIEKQFICRLFWFVWLYVSINKSRGREDSKTNTETINHGCSGSFSEIRNNKFKVFEKSRTRFDHLCVATIGFRKAQIQFLQVNSCEIGRISLEYKSLLWYKEKKQKQTSGWQVGRWDWPQISQSHSHDSTSRTESSMTSLDASKQMFKVNKHENESTHSSWESFVFAVEK